MRDELATYADTPTKELVRVVRVCSAKTRESGRRDPCFLAIAQSQHHTDASQSSPALRVLCKCADSVRLLSSVKRHCSLSSRPIDRSIDHTHAHTIRTNHASNHLRCVAPSERFCHPKSTHWQSLDSAQSVLDMIRGRGDLARVTCDLRGVYAAMSASPCSVYRVGACTSTHAASPASRAAFLERPARSARTHAMRTRSLQVSPRSAQAASQLSLPPQTQQAQQPPPPPPLSLLP